MGCNYLDLGQSLEIEHRNPEISHFRGYGLLSALSMHIKLVTFGARSGSALGAARRRTSGAAEVDASRQRPPPRFDPPLILSCTRQYGDLLCTLSPSLVCSIHWTCGCYIMSSAICSSVICNLYVSDIPMALKIASLLGIRVVCVVHRI